MAVYVDPDSGIAYPNEGSGPLASNPNPGVATPGVADQGFQADAPGRTAADLAGIEAKYGLKVDPSDVQAYLNGRGQLADFEQRLAARVGSGGGGRSAATTNGPSYGAFALSGALPPEYTIQPFGETYTPLATPAGLATPYVAPHFSETFKAPTMADLEADSGYLSAQAAIQRGLERGAASKGSVLSGGFVGRTVPRALTENAYSAYQSLYGRAAGEFQQRADQFNTEAARGLAARQQNESEFNDANARNYQGYTARYQSYLDQITNARNARNDYFNNNYDLARLGLDATTAGRPLA